MIEEQLKDLRAQVETAYADTQGNGGFDSSRCLSFLMSEWVSPRDASELVEIIGGYNAFNPETVQEMLSDIERLDPTARVALGREGSPVIYVETEDPKGVLSIFDSQWNNENVASPWGRGAPDELWRIDLNISTVGKVRRTPEYAHKSCAHTHPPVPDEKIADVDPEKDYIRAWWD